MSDHLPLVATSSARRPSDVSEHGTSRKKPRSRSMGLREQQHQHVLATIDQELKEAREAQLRASHRVAVLDEDWARARLAELQEARFLRTKRMQSAEFRASLRKRFQRAVRLVITRRHFLDSLNKELQEQTILGPQLPKLLQSQLVNLQHRLHELKYKSEDRTAAALRLQAWWRGTLMRRIVYILRTAYIIAKVRNQMTEAAVKVQRWYASTKARLKWKAKMQFRLHLRQQQEFFLEEHKIRVVVQLQRAVRARLARKRLAEAQMANLKLYNQWDFLEDETQQQPTAEHLDAILIDGWRPRGEDGSWLEDVRQKPPPKDRELEKIEEAGLIPFHWSVKTERMRHHIGGQQALQMQKQLRIGKPGSDEELLEDSADFVANFRQRSLSFQLEDEQPELLSIENNWNVYPTGLSHGFIKNLDPEVWPLKQSSKTKKVVEVPKKKKRYRPPPPPSNIEKRLNFREEKRQEAEVEAAKALAAEAVAHLQHPLLDGFLPNVPMNPSAPLGPPTGRPRPCRGAVIASDFRSRKSEVNMRYQDDDCSWSDATSFYTGGTRKRTGGFDEPLHFMSLAERYPNEQLAIGF